MIASDRILKLITLIRMFGAAPSAPTAEDDLATYIAVLRRQLCALVITLKTAVTLRNRYSFRGASALEVE